jgi:hypothetical protein
MTVAVARHSGIRRKGWASRLVVLAVALAFALQAYATQTHIHGLAQGAGVLAKVAAGPVPGKAPADDSQADCPLCHAIAHSGVFVGAAPPLLQVPFAWVQTAALVFRARVISHRAVHNWQSRAPPRA